MDVRTMEMTNDEKVEFVRLAIVWCIKFGFIIVLFILIFIVNVIGERYFRRYIPILRQFKLSPYIKG